MKEKFILPINLENLPFKAYQVEAFEFASLKTLNKDIFPLMYSFFINCYYLRDETHLDFNFTCSKRSFFWGYDAFRHKNFTLSPDILETETSLISYIKSYIKDSAYVVSEFDEYYIPNKNAYGKYHFPHTFFLYGFDDNIQSFMAIGYTSRRKFEKYEVKYQDFYNALISRDSKYLMLRYPNENCDFKFKLLVCCLELGWYVNSTYNDAKPSPKERYGLSAYKGFIEYVKEKIDAGDYLDVRFSRFFMEQKMFMTNRLQYLFENKYLSINYGDVHKPIEDNHKLVHLLFLKYNMTHKKDIGAKIIQILKSTYELEVPLLTEVLNELLDKLDIKERNIYENECLIDMDQLFIRLGLTKS